MQGQFFFIGLSCYVHFCLLQFLLSLSVYRLVLWGWGLWTDKGVDHSLQALLYRHILILLIIITVNFMLKITRHAISPGSKSHDGDTLVPCVWFVYK